MDEVDDDMEADDKPAEYRTYKLCLMNCAAGHLDDRNGEQISIVTVARTEAIEAWAFDLHDTRTMVTGLLVALASYEDEFARKLLDGNFPADDEGNFMWPRS